MAVARPAVSHGAGYGALALGVVALAGARLFTGGWYGTYEPFGLNVMERWPVAWETVYYTDHLPTFLGDGPTLGIAAVQYRTLLNLFLGSLVYGWSASAYWSLAAVDLLLWFLAGAATYHAMRRLGASQLAACAGTALVVSSPVLVSNMWRNDLHVANFATAAIGLWGGLVIVDEVRGTRALIGALGALLLLLSLSYQYQWVVLPAAAVLLRFRAGYSTQRSAVIALGALALLVAGTVTIRVAFALVGLAPTGAEVTAVQQPDQLVGGQLAGVSSVRDVLTLLPGARHVSITAQAYHPVVLAAGTLGLLLFRPHVWLAGLVSAALSLLAVTLYPAPWTAMSAYPFVYLGAGQACAIVGYAAQRLLRTGDQRVAIVIVIALVLALAALTNGDLWGDYRFLLVWWRLYYGQRVF